MNSSPRRRSSWPSRTRKSSGRTREIEQARRAVEEKNCDRTGTHFEVQVGILAEHVARELRTPLNSILILGQQLERELQEGNLAPKQVEFARTIHGAGTDLLNLITDILDLSKIESGTVTVVAEEVVLSSAVLDGRRAAVPPRGREQGVEPRRAGGVPRLKQHDCHRLQAPPAGCSRTSSLSNAFKFTETGGVRVRVGPAPSGWSPDHPVLKRAGGPWWHSKCPIPVSAFRRRSSASFSKPSSRPTPAPAASTAAPGSASRSRASSRHCSAAKSSCAVRRASAAPSRSTCPRCMSVRP